MNTYVTVRKADRGRFLAFGAPMLLALWFVQGYVLHYFNMDPGALGIYEPRRNWLYAHLAGGTAALLLGPVQLWLGLNHRSLSLHRILGVGYVLGVAVGSAAAFYLAIHTDFGWVAGLGFSTMSLAWVLSTTLAVVSISRRLIQQHQEWMIRSYVVTFSFVTFRILEDIFNIADIGTTVEQITAASWMCWSAPLLITECILQSRKVFAPRESPQTSEPQTEPTFVSAQLESGQES